MSRRIWVPFKPIERPPGESNYVAFGCDSGTGDSGYSIDILDVNDSFSLVPGTPAQANNVEALAFTKDSSRLIVGTAAVGNRIYAYNTSNWSEIGLGQASIRRCDALDTSYSNDRFAAVEASVRATIWNTKSLTVNTQDVVISSSNNHRVRWRRDDALCGFATQGTAQEISDNSRETVNWGTAYTLSPQLTDHAYGIAWSPDNSLLVMVGRFSTHARLFNAVTGAEISWPLDFGATNVRCADFSPDGTMLALGLTATDGLRVYNTSDWSQVAVTSPDINFGFKSNVFWSWEGGYLAMASTTATTECRCVMETTNWTKVYTSNISSKDCSWS